MVDNHTTKQRSYNMSRVRNKNTRPELLIRKSLSNNGIKGYRINAKLPGKPDIVFTKKKIAIFIDGCFWHKCPKCYKLPKTNIEFWKKKINGNLIRDKKINIILSQLGFKVIRVRTHEIKKDINRCMSKIFKLLEYSP